MVFDLESLEKYPHDIVYEIDDATGLAVHKFVTYEIAKDGNEIYIRRVRETIILPREQFERESEEYHQETMRQIRERSAEIIAEFA